MTYLHCSQAFIVRDIDMSTEHWDAESVPRAVASVAPEVNNWRELRSLPLAVLMSRAITALGCQRMGTNNERQRRAAVSVGTSNEQIDA